MNHKFGEAKFVQSKVTFGELMERNSKYYLFKTFSLIV